MKNPTFLFSENVWRGSLIVFSYFLLAACMQHEESLAPRNHEVINDITTQANDVALLTKRTFTAHLIGANETPPVESQGQGQAIFTLSKDGTVLHYKVIVANLETATILAHIHCGAEGVMGPPIANLFTGDATNKNGVIAEGDITSVIPRSEVACQGTAVSTFNDLIARLRNGTAYVNVHTTEHGGGEIRGQIK